MSHEIKVLDFGYIRLIEHWGSDERIIEAARMSTDKGFQGWGPRCCRCGLTQEDHERGMMMLSQTCGDQAPQTHDFKAGDERLLKYLWNNRHTTPFEMAGAIIEVQAPIFVFREWHRHRMQCLAGSTMICCVTPSGATYYRSIKDIFDLKYGGVEDESPRTKNGYSRSGTPVTREARRKVPWRTRVLPNCQKRLLRVLNEETLEFSTAPMADVWESGVKQLYAVETERGDLVHASAEHPFFTEHGWKRIKELKVGDKIARMGKVAAFDRPIPPALRAGIGVWTTMMRSRLIRQPKDICYLCEREFKFDDLELDHVVSVSADLLLALDARNLKPSCKRCHRNKTNAEQPSREGMTRRGVRWEVVSSIRKIGKEMTYDIEVEGPHHNYVANGLIVHNSYNELSARYTPLPDVNYTPSIERLLGGLPGREGHPQNKQAGTIPDAEVLTLDSALEWLASLADVYDHAERVYQDGLRRGIPKELARLPVPVARYSRMRAQAVLLNWCRFLGLRSDKNPGAQWEIRAFANALFTLLTPIFPRTMALFEEKPL